jgi:protein-disulfide isomerase
MTIALLRRPIAVAALVLVWAPQLHGQAQDANALISRIDALEATVKSLTKQIADLNRMLRSALPPPPVEDVSPFDISVVNAPMRGARDAQIALIEFGDFECPFCGRHAQMAYPDVLRRFVDTGKVKYVFKHLPLDQLHQSAFKAAEASECAAAQGKFWQMHDRLYANQKNLLLSDLGNHARALNLDLPRFQTCLMDGLTGERIKNDVAEANRFGLTATPAFLIGRIDSKQMVHVTKKISGSQPFPVFQSALDDVLAGFDGAAR